jgi:predicted DNA-binding protein
MAVRTQVYLTEEQRARLDELARRQGQAMAQLIREAIDRFLAEGDDLDATFGSAPGIGGRVPSRDEWERRG